MISSADASSLLQNCQVYATGAEVHAYLLASDEFVSGDVEAGR